MRRLLILLAFSTALHAQILQPIISGSKPFTYHVDATGGDDGNPGTRALPFKTIAKVNGLTLNPGESVGFKRGETWRETLTPGQSGTAGSPITFGAYGSGAKPKITGANTFNATGNWSQVSSGGTVTSSPAVSADDGYWTNTTNFTVADNWIYVGGVYAVSPTDAFIRFPNITIPQGTTITSASVALKSATTDTNTGLSTTIKAIDEDDAAAPTSAADGNDRTLTTASVSWTTPDNWQALQAYTTADITDVVKEVVDRALWESGNAIVLYFTGTGGAYVYHIALPIDNAANYPVLSVSYGAPVANLWKASVANDPGTVLLDGAPGTRVAAEEDLVSQGQWWFNDASNLVEIYSESNPATYYANIQIPVRQYAVYVESKESINVQSLDLQATYGAVLYGYQTPTVRLSNLTVSYGSQYSILNNGGNAWTVANSDIGYTAAIPSTTTYGLVFSAVTGGTLRGNKIHHNQGEYASLVTGSSGVDALSNELYSNNGDAYRIDSITGGVNNFLFNLVHDNGAVPPSFAVGNGIYVSPFTTGSVNVYHNTFYNNGAATSNGQNMHIVSSGGTTNVKNNISYQDSDAASARYCMDTYISTAVAYSNNLYFKTTSAATGMVWIDNDPDPNTTHAYLATLAGLGLWQIYTGQDANSTAGSDPLLNADYTLGAGSPAIGAGVYIAGVSTSANPNIGAK